MSAQIITGTVDINSLTIYDDDVIANDALFNISADARLVLLGDDQFNNSTLAMAGQLRVRGPLAIEGLTLEDTALLANNSTITQTSEVSLGASSDDAVVVRNLPGATWDVASSTEISQTGEKSRFLNLGLFEQTGADDTLTVTANFICPGTVQAEGAIKFEGALTRLFGAVSAASVSADDVFLDGAAISTAGNFDAQSVIVRGAASVTAANVILDATDDNVGVHLQSGARLQFEGERSITLGNVRGIGEIDLQGTTVLHGSYPNTLTLTGDIKLVNSGTVSPSPLPSDLLTAVFSISATPTNGGQVEIDNLAGAVWVDNNQDTSFNGDGTANAFFQNFGTLQDSGQNGGINGGTIFNMNVINDGLIESGAVSPSASDILDYNGFIFDNAVTGTGTVDVGVDAATFNVSVGSGQTIAFTSAPSDYIPILTLNDVQDFAAVISGFDQNGATDDRIVANTASWQFEDFAPNAGGTGGDLIFSNGAAQTSVSLIGDYDPTKFHAAIAGSQTTITYG